MLRKQITAVWPAFLALVGLTLACNFSGTPTATPIPTPIPTQVEGGENATAVLPTAVALPTDTAAAETAVPATATGAATAAPTATTVPAATAPPAAASATPKTGVAGTFGPGQQDTFILEAGGYKTYAVQATKFQPLFVFAETEGEADLRLAVAAESAAANPGAAVPLTEADISPAGRPEVMVFTPEADGVYTLIIGNQGSGAGETAVYLFDEATDTPIATHHRGETLAAGQSKSYSVQSNGGRPIVAFAQPLDESDLVLRFIEAGSVVNEANYSGPGSPEAAFVLPLRTTDYTIEISTANGGAAAYTLIVFPLE